jgi:hypothetical protein
MTTRSLILSLILLSPNVASAQTTVPKGPPPTFALVQEFTPQKGEIVLTRMVGVELFVPYVAKMVIDGKEQAVTKFKVEIRYEIRLATIDASSSRVITPDGKQLPIDEVWKRLKKQQVILESSETPHAAYLGALHPDALVLIRGPSTKQPRLIKN